MLDLEGVLIATGKPSKKNKAINGYGVRPNAQLFIDKSLRLFDEIYLNTTVDEKRALKIMRDVFETDAILSLP